MKKIMQKFFNRFPYFIPYFWYKMATLLFRNTTFPKFENAYGKFKLLKNPDKYSFTLSNESQHFYWEIAKMILDITDNTFAKVLLPGENDISKKEIQAGLAHKLWKSEIHSIWLSKWVDFRWDFEDQIPENVWKYSLIISQAMIEHLVDPYKHMKDLSSMLEQWGYLIVHTVLPGFMYHRYPIDTMRFYPDWFEEIATEKRCNLQIVQKYIREFHIFYMYKKN